MKKNYDTPELEMILISKDDVLNASPQDVDDNYPETTNPDWFA